MLSLCLFRGGFKIGVHIADVASFIPPYSALDVEAGQRSTSVYLVQRVIPMLPSILCEELCSLNPGVDRFAFSVVWEVEMDEEDEAGPVVIKVGERHYLLISSPCPPSFLPLISKR